jgi:hypothetical protein
VYERVLSGCAQDALFYVDFNTNFPKNRRFQMQQDIKTLYLNYRFYGIRESLRILPLSRTQDKLLLSGGAT